MASSDVASGSGPSGETLLLQLGSTNDENGQLDGDAFARSELTKKLFDEITALGGRVRVLPSGGSDPSFSFNPTDTPHWKYVADTLLEAGVPVDSLLPGLPALHTVHEALLCHTLVEERWRELGKAKGSIELVVVTSDFHAARARHLFGVAFGDHAGLAVRVRVDCARDELAGEVLAARQAHEKRSLELLRTAPFGPWLEFVKARGLEACNRSRRFSRKMN